MIKGRLQDGDKSSVKGEITALRGSENADKRAIKGWERDPKIPCSPGAGQALPVELCHGIVPWNCAPLRVPSRAGMRLLLPQGSAASRTN